MCSDLLRIAITVDPEIPVPPLYYGGIERIVEMLVRELQQRGHSVHLFSNRLSTVDVSLAPYPGGSSLSRRDTLRNMRYIWTFLRKNDPFDIIHSFSRLAYLLPVLPAAQVKVQSYQRAISPRSIRLGTMLAGSSLTFTSCSASNAAPVRDLTNRWAIIHNGVEIARYDFVDGVNSDAPLVFLGRLERIKGAHTAIEVANRTGRRLLIAGNHATSGEEADYFRHEILPKCDDEQIIYLGPVDDAQKNILLGQAVAMLFPIEWEEPFGIVMVEALACGTPVIAFKRGSVSEVIDQGKTGFICDTTEEMISAVQRIDAIDRKNCRRVVEVRFSEKVITDQYEALYYSAATTIRQPIRQ